MVNVLPNPVLNKYLYLPCVWVCVGGCVCVGAQAGRWMSRHSYTFLVTLSRPADCQDRNVKTGLKWFQMFQNGSCLNFSTGLDKVYHCAKSVLTLISNHSTFHWPCWISSTPKCTLILISNRFIAILALVMTT